MVHCSAMICQSVTLSGDAEWPKVADAVIEAGTATPAAAWTGEAGVPVSIAVAGESGSSPDAIGRGDILRQRYQVARA